MPTRADTWTTLAVAAIVVGSLMACKKKKEESSAGGATPTAETTAAKPPPQPTLPDKLHKLGETAKAFDYALTVDNVKECKRRYSVPKKGNIFLGVEVTVENIADKQFHVFTTHAKIVDSQNLTYGAMGYASTANCDPMFASRLTQLAKGEKAKGWLVFEVPKDGTSLKLSYNPTTFGTPQTVKFDLGR